MVKPPGSSIEYQSGLSQEMVELRSQNFTSEMVFSCSVAPPLGRNGNCQSNGRVAVLSHPLLAKMATAGKATTSAKTNDVMGWQ